MTRVACLTWRGVRLAASALVLALGAAVIPAFVPTPARAQAPAAQTIAPPPLGVDTVLDARAKAISSRLRCPVCQGESIQDSPAELAGQMKTLVREQLANGKSEAEVLDYFTQKYGQWILLEPKAEGINLLVYWLPVAFIVLGGAALWVVVKKWTRAPDPS